MPIVYSHGFEPRSPPSKGDVLPVRRTVNILKNLVRVNGYAPLLRVSKTRRLLLSDTLVQCLRVELNSLVWKTSVSPTTPTMLFFYYMFSICDS